MPQPHHDDICWATWCSVHTDKRMIVLNRHAPQPTEEELSHMREVAERLWPSTAWRGPVSMPQHFHLHQV